MLEVFAVVALLLLSGLLLLDGTRALVWALRGRRELALPPVPGNPYRGVSHTELAPRRPRRRHPIDGLRYVAPEAWPDWARERGRRG